MRTVSENTNVRGLDGNRTHDLDFRAAQYHAPLKTCFHCDQLIRWSLVQNFWFRFISVRGLLWCEGTHSSGIQILARHDEACCWLLQVELCARGLRC